MTAASHRGLVVTTFFLAMALATPALSDPLVIEGVGLSRDIPCDDSDVSVYGANNTINFTGACKTITIDGSSQTVTFEKGADLIVAGLQQKISGGEVSSLRLDGSGTQLQATVKPSSEGGTVDIAGVQQKLELAFAGAITLTVQGFDHDIAWSKLAGAPEPKISASGIQTKIVKK